MEVGIRNYLLKFEGVEASVYVSINIDYVMY